MKVKWFVVLILAVLLLAAWTTPRYKIVSLRDWEYYGGTLKLYNVCLWDGSSCGAVYNAWPLAPGRLPPVGAVCRLVNGDELDCGCRYVRLLIAWPCD